MTADYVAGTLNSELVKEIAGKNMKLIDIFENYCNFKDYKMGTTEKVEK